MPEDFSSRFFDDSTENTHRGRLLSTYPKSEILQSAAKIGFAYRTPRDQVLSVTAVLAASMPLAAYNVTYHYEKWKPMYDNGTSLYVNWCDNETNDTDCLTLSNDTKFQDLAQIEKQVLTDSRAQIKTVMGTSYKSDYFEGSRETGCAQMGSTGERCFGDEGVAMSHYEDDSSMIVVFQAGLGETDRNNLIWQNKAWLIESFEDAMVEQWILNAQQATSSEVTGRKAADTYEFPVRCGFLNETYAPISDETAVSVASEVSVANLQDEGLWPLMKLVVRKVLAEGASFTKTVYLAGTGLGGSHAALISMWLKKNEDKSYDTYVIAAPGFQCIARDKYSKDMTPSDTHSQLKIYTHVMDALAGSVDQYSGTVCRYGLRNFTAAEPFYAYCSRMVGHTGPEIFWRPSTTSTTTTADDATAADLAAFAEYDVNITTAQEAFDQCHMYTHSIWYALMLFSDEDTLNLDGTTDGGCETVSPIDSADKYGKCPTTATATTDCANFFAPSAEVSMQMLAIIVGSTGGVIACCAVLGIMVVRHVQKNAMEDVATTTDQGPPATGCFARLMRNCGVYLGAKGVDRAKDARIRAKKARDKRKNRNFQEKANLIDAGADGGAQATMVGRQQEDTIENVEVEIGDNPKTKKDKKDLHPHHSHHFQRHRAHAVSPGVALGFSSSAAVGICEWPAVKWACRAHYSPQECAEMEGHLLQVAPFQCNASSIPPLLVSPPKRK